MPRYELAVIYRAMERPELVQAIKRTSESIFNAGGIIRSMDNVGCQQLPYKMFRHGKRFENGNYFLIHFDSKPTVVPGIHDQMRLDTDVIRQRVLRAEVMTSRPCLHRECDFGELTEEKRGRLFKDLKQFVQKL